MLKKFDFFKTYIQKKKKCSFRFCSLNDSKISIIFSKSRNIYLNLALEEFLYENLKMPTLLLWKNSNSVIIGKYSNIIIN